MNSMSGEEVLPLILCSRPTRFLLPWEGRLSLWEQLPPPQFRTLLASACAKFPCSNSNAHHKLNSSTLSALEKFPSFCLLYTHTSGRLRANMPISPHNNKRRWFCPSTLFHWTRELHSFAKLPIGNSLSKGKPLFSGTIFLWWLVKSQSLITVY